MSKAFTREDDVAEEPVLIRPASTLPPGVKNYITANGAKQLRQELEQLALVERPGLIGRTDDDSKRQLQVIDHRIASLGNSLQTAEIVEPTNDPEKIVRFGATVTVKTREGSKTDYRIVGVDETDIDRDWVSWRSPIARALINARPGQRVQFKFPAGEEELEIVDVVYV